MRMKKRVISMLLAISMIASLVCVPAFADDVTGGDDHDHIVSDVQDEGQEQGAPDGGQEGGAGPDEAITPPATSTDESDIPTGEPEEIVYTTCIHGKTMGETCELCGELAHSSKNIPLIGYDQEFFDQVNPDEDEVWLLYTIRLVCPHGTADGVYCEKCGHVVDSDPAGLPMCTILDCCLHGHVKGEKCEACQELKEEQGDYELAEGEAWDDPLIYTTDLMAFDSNVAEMNGNGYLHCTWCGRALGDGINVSYHRADNTYDGHWCRIARVEARGTCEDHYVTWVYECGFRIATNNTPYPCHHLGNCTWNTYKNWHSDTLTAATCQNEGKIQKYYTSTCIHCDATSPALGMTTETVPKLDHIITGTEYKDSKLHQISCAGNGTGAHTFTEEHNFVQNGEDYNCSGCDAVKTTVHVDAYTLDGELVKEDLVTDIVEVGHNGPENISIQEYLGEATSVAKKSFLYPIEEQNDAAVVQTGGIHLKCYVVVDIEAPTITASVANDTVAITVYDDLSGLRSVSYFGKIVNVTNPQQHVGESNKKELYFDIRELVNGTYQVTAIDHAGNSKTIDVEINKEEETPVGFSLYVPSVITFTVDKDGNVTMDPENPKLYNGVVEKPICITGIEINANGEWSLADFDTTFTDADLDAKRVALSINGIPVSVDGSVAINKSAWVIPADGLISLDLDIKAPKQSSVQTLTNVFTITFTADWYDESTDPELPGVITITPNPVEVKARESVLFDIEYDDFLSISSISLENGNIAKIAKPFGINDEIKKHFSLDSMNKEFVFYYKYNGTTKVVDVWDEFTEDTTFGQLLGFINNQLGDGLTSGFDALGGFFVIDLDGNYVDIYVESTSSYNIITLFDIVTKGHRKMHIAGLQEGDTLLNITMSNGKALECPVRVIQKVVSAPHWRSYKKILPAEHWIGLEFGNGKFVLLAGGDYDPATNAVAYSTDGETWTYTNNMPVKLCWSSIAYGNGKFIAVGCAPDRSPTTTFAYSSDGIEWHSGNMPSARWDYITYGNGEFIAIGWDGSHRIYAYTRDGTSWDYEAYDNNNIYHRVCIGTDKYISYATSLGAGTSYTVYASKNGHDWQLQKTKVNTSECAIYHDGQFILGGYRYMSGYSEERSVCMYSEDGVNWEMWTLESIPEPGRIYMMCYTDEIYVATDAKGHTYYSHDGRTWEQGESVPLDTTMFASGRNVMAYGNGVLVIVDSRSSAVNSYCATITK